MGLGLGLGLGLELGLGIGLGEPMTRRTPRASEVSLAFAWCT